MTPKMVVVTVTRDDRSDLRHPQLPLSHPPHLRAFLDLQLLEHDAIPSRPLSR